MIVIVIAVLYVGLAADTLATLMELLCTEESCAPSSACSNRTCSVKTTRSWVAVGVAVGRGSVSLR